METQENPLGLDGAYWAAAIASSLLLGVFGASYAAWVAWKRGWQAPLVIFGTFAVLWTVVVAVALVVR